MKGKNTRISVPSIFLPHFPALLFVDGAMLLSDNVSLNIESRSPMEREH
jgi:hypothetical protein